MILYLDTSALVPLLISEPSSRTCAELWDAADGIAVARVAYVEAHATLARAIRLNRITARQGRAARQAFAELWDVIDVVELDRDLMVRASMLSETHALGAYDATHCAAALLLEDPELVAASGDAALVSAWQSEGIAVRNTNR